VGRSDNPLHPGQMANLCPVALATSVVPPSPAAFLSGQEHSSGLWSVECIRPLCLIALCGDRLVQHIPASLSCMLWVRS
jgi:hypothetical protein